MDKNKPIALLQKELAKSEQEQEKIRSMRAKAKKLEEKVGGRSKKRYDLLAKSVQDTFSFDLLDIPSLFGLLYLGSESANKQKFDFEKIREIGFSHLGIRPENEEKLHVKSTEENADENLIPQES